MGIKCNRPKIVNLQTLKKQLQWLVSQHGKDAKDVCQVGLELIAECEQANFKKIPIDIWETALGGKLNSLYYGFMQIDPVPQGKLPEKIDWDKVTKEEIFNEEKPNEDEDEEEFESEF